MAQAIFTVKVNQALPGGKYSLTPGAVALIDYTAFAAALATLVADGASPTQAHVTTANNAWTTLKGQIDGYAANVTLLIDKSVVTNMNQVRGALRELERMATSTSAFTA